MSKICQTAQALSTTISYPLKHKFGYPRAVTVCLAAVNKGSGEPRIILCSDTRLDYGDLGSTNTTVKLDVLGHGWCVQLAGEWSGVSYLCSLLKERIQKRDDPPDSMEQIEKLTRLALDNFIASSFCNQKQTYQALLSGFLLGSPTIAEASVYKNHPKLDLCDSFGAIGSGSVAATFMLGLRECHPQMPLSYSIYLAYEAKRASEKTGYVGQFTALVVQAPHVPDSKDRAHLAVMNLEGIANLDSIYRSVWKVPFVEMPDFPDDFFHCA